MSYRPATSVPQTLQEMWQRFEEYVKQTEVKVIENVLVGTTETAVAHGLGVVPYMVGWDPPHCLAVVGQTRRADRKCVYLKASNQCAITLKLVRWAQTVDLLKNGGYDLDDVDLDGDHKVAVDQADEDAGGADYLLAKLSNNGNVVFSLDGQQVKADAADIYDFSFGWYGLTPSGTVALLHHPCVRATTLPADLTGSRAIATAIATSDTTYTFKKNSTAFATCTFPAGSATGSYVCASEVSLTDSDTVWLYGPAVADGTLYSPSFTLKGTR